MKSIKLAIFCTLSLIALVGCRPGMNQLEREIAEIKAQPAPPLDPLPVIRQFESFEYVAEGLRDPFAAPAPDRNSGSGPRPNADRRKEPLEAFPLDSMDMVGTIGSGAGLTALLLAPDKTTYKVRVGNYVGQNDGRIVGLYADRIELVELVPDGAGGWLERQAKIALEDN
jgi:type IV pilus assembly protein PilP